ncbi:MAG TPA: hypothetical protein VKR52_04705 [Terracidiphilus sp.]|nr:hypothetical protein [Terracidiphilus sp.]
MPPTGTKSKRKPHTSDPTDFELGQQIAELRGITVAGFKAVNDHLSTLNGRVGKHDELFNKILGNEKFEAGARQGFATSWKVIFALVTITLGILAIVFGPH